MEDIRQIPAVREFLLDTSVYDHLEKIAEKHQLPVGRIDEFLDLTNAVLKKQVSLGQFSEMIAKAFGVDQKKAELVSADVCGYALLPLVNYLPGVEDQIKAWGGKIEDYPRRRILKQEAAPDMLVRNFAQEIALKLPDHLMKRFVYLIKGYMTGERDAEATKTLLMRPINIGGLAFKEEMVKKLFEVLKEKGLTGKKEVEKEGELLAEKPPTILLGTKEEDERLQKEYDALDKKEEEMIRLRKESAELLKKEKGQQREPIKIVKKENDKRWIPVHARNDKKKKKELLPVKSTSHELSTSVPVINGPEKTLIEIFRRKKISKKAREGIVNAHMRGIRELHQTEGLLKDRYKLKGKDLGVVMKTLKKMGNEGGQVVKDSSGQDKKVKERNEVAKKEKALLNDRHAAMTKKISDEEIEPAMPHARVSAARSKGEELNLQNAKVPKEKVIAAQTASKPKKAKAKVSAQTVMSEKNTEKKKVADIKMARALVGPIDEIGTLSVAQFRRFSSDPKEGVEKILDKLALLESTSYEDRIKGVKAWRSSPLNLLYLSMVREALEQGVSIAEAASARRNAGKESLSPSEIQAIVGLNRKMKF
jgi:hypothetical protein